MAETVPDRPGAPTRGRCAEGELVPPQPPGARAVVLPRSRRPVLPRLRHLPDRPELRDLPLQVGRARRGEVHRSQELREALQRPGVRDLPLEQSQVAGPVPSRGPRRALHRHFPEPDGHRHPPLQVALLLSLRHQPGRRGARLHLVLRPDVRAAERNHRVVRGGTDQRSRGPRARHLRDHRRRPLAADRLLHDPLSHRAQRGRPRAGRGREAGRRAGVANAVARRSSPSSAPRPSSPSW